MSNNSTSQISWQASRTIGHVYHFFAYHAALATLLATDIIKVASPTQLSIASAISGGHILSIVISGFTTHHHSTPAKTKVAQPVNDTSESPILIATDMSLTSYAPTTDPLSDHGLAYWATHRVSFEIEKRDSNTPLSPIEKFQLRRDSYLAVAEESKIDKNYSRELANEYANSWKQIDSLAHN